MHKVIAFLNDESGATAIEYGLIAAGISVVIIATVNAIGSTLKAKFDYISQQLNERRLKLSSPGPPASYLQGNRFRWFSR